jgi:hypothetical protein
LQLSLSWFSLFISGLHKPLHKTLIACNGQPWRSVNALRIQETQ